MNSLLLDRQSGLGSSLTFHQNVYHDLFSTLAPAAPTFAKSSKISGRSQDKIRITPSTSSASTISVPVAHYGGTNALTIEPFSGRFLLSGGADSSISLWDLESSTYPAAVLNPTGTVKRSKSTHKFGITDLSFYPFDASAFLSSSYDTTLKVYSTETLTPVASFGLDAPIYSLAISPIADHLLVATGSQLPDVRLVDLRSSSTAHTLAGHLGAVLSVAWSPVAEYILASAGADGTVRFWDIRRAAGQIGVLDKEDGVGILGYDGCGNGARHASRGKAHEGACNGIVWSEDGRTLVSTGHDEKVRVWDTTRGANMFVHFGAGVRNRAMGRLVPCLVPSSVTGLGKEMVIFPGEKDLGVYEMFEGRVNSRMRISGATMLPTGEKDEKSVSVRTKDLAWRHGSVEAYSGHADGSIRAWKPKALEPVVDQIEEDPERKRKREVLDEIYQSISKRTFTMSQADGN
jgi:DNA excision repair protein ERCC-8